MKINNRYMLQQFLYYAAGASLFCFAVSFLLDRGFPASQTGLILGAANILSFVLQPTLGAFVDRSRRAVLTPILLGMAAITIVGLSVLLLVELPVPLFAILYLIAIPIFYSMLSLMNSITVYYRSDSEEISFAKGRAAGSLSYGIFTFLLGYVIVFSGLDWIMWFAVAVLVIYFVITLGFLRHVPQREGKAQNAQDSLSLFQFFKKYRRFTVNLLGVLFLSMFHSMTENYIIVIMESLGGNSSNQGTALAIATISSVPAFFVMDRVRQKLSVRGLFLVSGCFFILKSVLFMLATSVGFIYLVQLLQTVTYAALASAQVYHADIAVEESDKVKGQTVSGASYTLGCALGNMAGGFLLDWFNLPVMLGAGVGMAVIGTFIFFISLEKDHRG